MGLRGGSNQHADMPPLEDNNQPAPSYQDATAAQHNIQPAVSNGENGNDDVYDDDDDVKEVQETPSSIQEQIVKAERRFRARKRKLQQLLEQEQKVQESKINAHRVQLYEAYCNMVEIINDYTDYQSRQLTRAFQMSHLTNKMRDYLEDPADNTPVQFQHQYLTRYFANMEFINDEINDMLNYAMCYFKENTPDD